MRARLHKPQSDNLSTHNYLRRSKVMPKLVKNKPGDVHEQEADHAADEIVKKSTSTNSLSPTGTGVVQAKPLSQTLTPRVQLKEEEDIQAKEEENVQLKEAEVAEVGMATPTDEEDPIRAQEVQAMESEGENESENESESEDTLFDAPEVQAKEEEGVQLQEEEVQAMESEGQSGSENEEVQAKEFVGSPETTVPDLSLQSSKGTGTSLPSDTLTEMNAGFGADFSGVKIHTDTQAETMNQSLGAQAFTHEKDIYFNSNKFNPSTDSGKFLLAHELAHTIQQGATPAKNGEEKDENAAKTNEKTSVSETKQEGKATDAPTVSVETPQNAVQSEAASKTGAAQLDGTAETTEIGEEADQGTEGKSDLQSPENDPEFQETLDYIGQTAEEESEHPNAGKKVKQVKQASVLPASKQERANDEAGHIAEMEETAKKRKPFEPSNFKDLLKKNLTDLEKQLPKDQDSAEEFKEKKPIDKVKQNIGNQVEAENAKISGPLASQAGSDKPPKSGGPVEHEKPIKPDGSGKTPKPFDPKNALPKKKKDAAISMEKESASMDEFMAKNNMSDEQLAKSEEPKFIEALDSKKTAQKKAAEVPQEYRKKEDEQLKGAEKTVSKENKQAFEQMHKDRSGTFAKVFGGQKSTEKTDEEKKAEMNDRFNKIYTQTQGYVTTKLEWLSEKVTAILEHDAEKAKRTFEKNVEEGLDDIYGWTTWDDKLFGEDTGAINRLFKKEKATFISAMDAAIDKISVIIANTLNAALADIERGRQKAKEYFEGLDKSWQKLGQESYDLFTDRYNTLEDSVYDTENELAQSLAQIYKDNVDSLEETFNELKEAASTGWLDGAWEMLKGIAETIQKLIDAVTNLLSAIARVLPVIIADPIGFMKQLFDGIGKGIDAFKANIQKHLMGGLIEWLTGSIGPMGITIPDDIFSLKGIFNLVLQVVGLGWDTIRIKAVKMMGEPMVNALTTGYDMFKTFASKGIDGIWEFLKDSFTDLKETVIESIKGMLITQVIEAGIKWLLSLLIPGAGFIKAIMAIKDIIVFFVESAVMLIPAITEAILALAAGSVAGVAKAIEFGLSKLIGLVINLFAKLIGLGGLSKKVMAIFGKIRKRVDKAVMKLLKKAQKAGRKLMQKIGIGKEDKATVPENRNTKEKEKDVRAGVHEAELLLKNDKLSVKSINKKLPAIKKKYGMKILELRKLNQGNTEKAYIYGEVNPTAKSSEYVVIDEMDVIVVTFRRREKHDETEYKRQLAGQEQGINKLKVVEWKANRAKFEQLKSEKGSGRSKDSNKYQREAHETLRADEIKRVMKEKGVNRREASEIVDKYVALHDPDQIAGGNANNITSLGEGGINSSIGSQWKDRISTVDGAVATLERKMNPDERKAVNMNVKLNLVNR